MKYLLHSLRFVLFVAFFALSSCGDAKSKLCKKWLLDGEALKSAVEAEIKKLEKEKPEEAGMAKVMLGMMGSMFKDGGIMMEFKKDGTCETTALGKSNKGKWELASDGKNIIIKTDKDDQKMEIKELTASKLVLLPENKNNKKPKISGMEMLIFKAGK